MLLRGTALIKHCGMTFVADHSHAEPLLACGILR